MVALQTDVQLLLFREQDRAHFHSGTHLAVEACKANLEDIQSLAKRMLNTARFESASRAIETFSAENPIDRSLSRKAARLTGSQSDNNPNLTWIVDTTMAPFRAIGGIDHTAQAIFSAAGVAAEATTVVSFMPEQVRWQLELLLYDLEKDDTVLSALSSMKTMSSSAESLSQTARDLPETVRQELVTVLEETEKNQKTLQETLRENT